MSEVKSEKKRLPLRPAGFVVPEDPKAEPYLIAARCRNCRQFFGPGRVLCLNCGKQDMEEFAYKGTGKLYTYTIVHQQLPGALVKMPYAVAIVAMDEGGQVTTAITEDLELLDVGMDMEVYFETMQVDAEGNDRIAYLFRPVKGR